jgi:hypothetical protein
LIFKCLKPAPSDPSFLYGPSVGIDVGTFLDNPHTGSSGSVGGKIQIDYKREGEAIPVTGHEGP